MFGPSPIHRLDRLSEYLEGATVWAKRDDVNSGLAFGGNKIRKLEYLVADALANGCDTLVSIGGVQSNHTRQVAAAAAKTGMKCVLIQESWVDWPDVTYDRAGNILLSRSWALTSVSFAPDSTSASRRVGRRRSLRSRTEAASPTPSRPARRTIPWADSVSPAGPKRSSSKRPSSASASTTSSSRSVTGGTQAGMIAGFAQDDDDPER